MVYIFGAISIISLLLNLLIFRKVAGLDIRPVIHFEIPASPERIRTEHEAVQEVEKPLVTVPMVQEVYSAWKNENGIPWSQSPPPPKPVQTTKPGPLERPHGFV